ncbi:SRPBCC domain-containing protein [Microbacterium sp. P05]|uniref:SRPBCC domain-containing protein n=1 Tax=Microbacterium sp. P05 TaxID=3366948 RepID=UPI0037473099
MNRSERIEHRAERTYEVIATPEQVWEVIATAEGLTSWMLPTNLEPRVGGAVTFDLGDVTSTGVVTAYEPDARFAFEEPWPIAEEPENLAPGMAQWFESIGVPLSEVYEGLTHVSPIATEFLIEAGSGGTCVLRVVTSAYGNGAEWENEFFDEMVASLGAILDNVATRFPASVR